MGLRRSWPTMGAFGLLLQKTFENAKDVSIMFYVRANLRNVFVTMNGCNTYIILLLLLQYFPNIRGDGLLAVLDSSPNPIPGLFNHNN